MSIPLDLQYGLLSLVYAALLLFSFRYVRNAAHGPISNVAALLGACALPFALLLAVAHWRVHDIFYASPIMFLSFVGWIVAGIRGEQAALTRPSEW